MKGILKIYVFSVAMVSVVGLFYVYLVPPDSMFVNREGVPHLTPPVIHAETGEPVPLGDLIKHYRGD